MAEQTITYSNLSVQIANAGSNNHNFTTSSREYIYYEKDTKIIFNFDLEGASKDDISMIQILGGSGVHFDTYIDVLLSTTDEKKKKKIWTSPVDYYEGFSDGILFQNSDGSYEYSLGKAGYYCYNNGKNLGSLATIDPIFRGFYLAITFKDNKGSLAINCSLPSNADGKSIILLGHSYFNTAPTNVNIVGGRETRTLEINNTTTHSFPLSNSQYIDGVWLYVDVPQDTIKNQSGFLEADGFLIQYKLWNGQTQRLFFPFDKTTNRQAIYISVSWGPSNLELLVSYTNKELYDDIDFPIVLNSSSIVQSNSLEKIEFSGGVQQLYFSNFNSTDFVEGEKQYFIISNESLDFFDNEGIIYYTLWFDGQMILDDIPLLCQTLKENNGVINLPYEQINVEKMTYIQTKINDYNGIGTPKVEATIRFNYEHHLAETKQIVLWSNQTNNYPQISFIIKHTPQIGREILPVYQNFKNEENEQGYYIISYDNNTYIPYLKKPLTLEDSKIQAATGYTLYIREKGSEEFQQREFSISNESDEYVILNEISFETNFNIWQAEAKIKWEYIENEETIYSCESEWSSLPDLYCAYINKNIITPTPAQDAQGNYIIIPDFELIHHNFEYTNFFLDKVEIKWTAKEEEKTEEIKTKIKTDIIKGQFVYLEDAYSGSDDTEPTGTLQLTYTTIDGTTFSTSELTAIVYTLKQPVVGFRHGGVIINPKGAKEPLEDGVAERIYVKSNLSGNQISGKAIDIVICDSKGKELKDSSNNNITCSIRYEGTQESSGVNGNFYFDDVNLHELQARDEEISNEITLTNQSLGQVNTSIGTLINTITSDYYKVIKRESNEISTKVNSSAGRKEFSGSFTFENVPQNAICNYLVGLNITNNNSYLFESGNYNDYPLHITSTSITTNGTTKTINYSGVYRSRTDDDRVGAFKVVAILYYSMIA